MYPKMIYWNVQKIVNNAAEEAQWSLSRRRVGLDAPPVVAVPDAIVEVAPKKSSTKKKP
jgi:RES domain-containing protein